MSETRLLRSMKIEIVDYRQDWPDEFLEIASKLRHAVRDLALRIDHIGSTAVPGLAAKDRIDIQITVKRLELEIEAALNLIGYNRFKHFKDHPPPGLPNRPGDWKKWIFQPPIEQRPTNLHVRVLGKPNQRYPLLFRDYLRAHASTAAAYAELKRRLSENLIDQNTYPDVKDPAVDLIYFAAENWAEQIGWKQGPSDA